jgi:hypothetical protein
MQKTWLVLTDGRAVDPAEVGADASGRLVHSSGVLVALRSADVPMSRSVDVDAERRKTRELTAQKPTRGYKTRENKAG